MNDKARHINKRIESEGVVDVETIKQEIDQHVNKIDDTNSEINPCHKIIVNEAERDDAIISQMEQWSILSNVVNYIQYNRHPKTSIIEILVL